MKNAAPRPAMPEVEFLEIELPDGIAVIRLNRPEVRNAIYDAMRTELIAAFDWADSDVEVRAVVLTGAGRSFCSGGDIGGMRERLEAPAGKVAFNGWRRQKRTNRSIAAIHDMSKPVVSALNGAAFGLGLDMALAGDFIIASEGAKMSMSFVNRGLVPDGGGMYFLPRRVGLVRAEELILSGRVMEAEKALAMGLVDRVVAPGALLDAARDWACELSQGSLAAIALTKAILDRSFESADDEVFALGHEAQAICYTTAEYRTSVEAFLDKSRK